MKHVLFVCTGNTCRSPMAEAMFRKKLQDQGISEIEVRSAGIAASDGSEASYGAQEVLKNRNIPADTHRSQLFTKELAEWADLILTMTASHKMWIANQYPQYLDKMFTLKEYVYGSEAGDHDIADPFGGDLNVYEMSAREIEGALEELLQILKTDGQKQ